MSLINYSSREINCKIVYYGPGLGGKTTNIQYIYDKLAPDTKGKLVTLATEMDRTLFFDFLPLELGEVKGFKTRFHLYTVPGQVYYNASRKLILRGCDGIVFVADSSEARFEANVESLYNLHENLKEYSLELDKIPFVIQWNKRDMPDALPIAELNEELNPEGFEFFEAVAFKGDGVFDTLKCVAKQVLRQSADPAGGGAGSAALDRPSLECPPHAPDERRPLTAGRSSMGPIAGGARGGGPPGAGRGSRGSAAASLDGGQPPGILVGGVDRTRGRRRMPRSLHRERIGPCSASWSSPSAPSSVPATRPIAPATVGSFGSRRALGALGPDPALGDQAVALGRGHVLMVVGIWAADLLERWHGEDPKLCVIDEVAGMQVTYFGLAAGPLGLLAGFFWFRLFDILKPFGVRRLEKLGGGGGIGIMADDVGAGVSWPWSRPGSPPTHWGGSDDRDRAPAHRGRGGRAARGPHVGHQQHPHPARPERARGGLRRHRRRP